jgi:Secretion system C-terminal sorting domain
MRQLFLFLFLASVSTFAQVIRVEPQNFSTVYFFGANGSFNDNEIAVTGYDGMLPNGIPKIYLFNLNASISANGSLISPEVNQNFSGGVEMTNDYLFIGSTSNNTNVTNGGAVFVYKKVNGNWVYLLKLQPPTQSENDRFGSNIVFHDNQLFVTASGYDSNGNSTVNNGGIYHYYLLQNDTFSFVTIMTGNESDFGYGDVLDFENTMLVTTSDGNTTDTVYTYKQGNVIWGLFNTMQMPVFTGFNVNVKASDRVSFSNGKLYLYHYLENAVPITEGKVVKIYNWSDPQSQWNFSEDFSFQEGDYLEYKVKVRDNNMYLIPVGDYILQMERKNPAFHYQFNGTSWNYFNSYTGMSSVTNDNFGYFTVAKANKVLFGNSMERWSNPFSAQNGGAYMIDATLDVDEVDNQNVVLFPNPTNGIISVTSINTQLTQVEVYDSIGKSIMTQNSNLDAIDLTSLSSGIYLCKITDSFGQFEIKKIIKN